MSPESIAKMIKTKKKNGTNVRWWKNKKFSKEHRKNISNSKKGIKLTNEHKKKLSQSQKGVNTWSKGRKLSEETKKKMSISRTGMVRNSKPVYQLDLDGNIIKLWDYPRKAEKELELPRKIHSVCIGKRKTTGGFMWCYVKDYK